MKSYTLKFLHAVQAVTFLALFTLNDQALAQGGSWTTKAPMPETRGGPVAAEVNGTIYVAGGGNTATPTSTFLAYDPMTDSWSAKAPMPTARFGPAGAEVKGIFYVAGGQPCGGCSQFSTLEAYDPSTNTWTRKADMPTPRDGAAAAGVNGILGVNANLYVVGGVIGCCPPIDLPTVEAYDPTTNTWSPKAPMPTSRTGLAVAVVDGILYAIGGFRGHHTPTGGPVATVEAYDPVTNTWTPKAPMPTARSGMAAGVVNGIIYVAGGADASGAPLSTLEAYDPATDIWTTETPMPTARSALGGAVVDDADFYAIGGVDASGALATVEAFSPAEQAPPREHKWKAKAKRPGQTSTVQLVDKDGNFVLCQGPISVQASGPPGTQGTVSCGGTVATCTTPPGPPARTRCSAMNPGPAGKTSPATCTVTRGGGAAGGTGIARCTVTDP